MQLLLHVNIRTCVPVKYSSIPDAHLQDQIFYWLEASCDFCSLSCAFLALSSSVNAEILKDG